MPLTHHYLTPIYFTLLTPTIGVDEHLFKPQGGGVHG